MNKQQRMPRFDDEQSSEISYRHTVGYTGLLGVIGALCVAISIVSGKSSEAWLMEALRDLGLMLFPLSVVSLICEVTLRRQSDQQSDKIMSALRRLDTLMNIIADDRGFVEIVYQEDRQRKMEEIIDGARDSLVIVGTSPLFEFAKKPDVLVRRFRELKSVTIVYLASDSEFVRSRGVQSGAVDGTREELGIHDKLVQELKANLKAYNVRFIPYDLPPAEFFYICDDRMLLANWYPFGESGVRCPCIFVENLQTNQSSERLLSHYMVSLDFIISSSEGAKESSKQAEIRPARSSGALLKGLLSGETFFNALGESMKRSTTDKDNKLEI